MKRQVWLILLCVGFLISACGDDAGDEHLEVREIRTVQDSIPTIQGKFLHLADAAVIKGDTFIYGVTIDTLALKLAREVEPYKKENFDMVPVKIKAKILKNPGDKGWDEFIEIREIIEAPLNAAALKASEE